MAARQDDEAAGGEASTSDDYGGVAVLLPCYNEEITVGKVVRDFREALPGATVWVFDNNSTDATAERAVEAGAMVVPSPRQGKGWVVQHMFEAVEADLYVMADGDDTYPASEAPHLVATLRETGADMVVGARLQTFDSGSFRRFHQFGNKLVAFLISSLFRSRVTDVLSGYRVFDRGFVKTVPLISGGFGIETEMTLNALAKNFLIREVSVPYGTRPEGSESKLNTFSDGFVVLYAIFMLFKDYRPLVFFGTSASLIAFLSLAAGALPVYEYVTGGYVYRVPLAVLAAALGLLSALSLGVGLVLSTIAQYHQENFVLLKRALQDRSR